MLAPELGQERENGDFFESMRQSMPNPVHVGAYMHSQDMTVGISKILLLTSSVRDPGLLQQNVHEVARCRIQTEPALRIELIDSNPGKLVAEEMKRVIVLE